MTLDAAEIEQAVRDQDASRVRELLKDATAAERRVCARELKAFLAEPDGPGREPWRGGLAARPAFGVAAVGLAAGAAPAYRAWREVDLSGRRGRGRARAGRDAIVGVLADHNPPWLAGFADRILREQFAQLRQANWQVVRDLVRLGLIERPDRAQYTTAMVTGIGGWDGQDVLSALRADPGLLDNEVWRLFTVPEAGAELDGWSSGWDAALVALTAAGVLDRGRLLDACLDVFVSDFPAHHVSWYRQLHDQLAPGPAERAARTGKYLALLSAPSKAGLTLGQQGCAALLDAGQLDPRAFLAASPAALVFPQKSAATAQLKLLDGLIKTRPELRDEALAAVAAAFGHDREDVQVTALKLVRKHGLPAGEAARAVVESLAAALSPVVAPDAVALGLLPAPAPPAGPVDVEQAAATVRDADFNPVEDPAELVQLLARLIEDAADPLAVERAMGGAVRLASLPLTERARLAGPLLKRARAQCWREDAVWRHVGTEARLAFLTIAWATGELTARAYPDWDEEPEYEHDPADWEPADPRHGVLSARLWGAGQLILAGAGGALLAEPEFADGTISPAVLLARLASWRPGSARSPGSPGSPGPARADVESALLRLRPPPGADDAFWSAWDAAPVVVAGEVPVATAARARYDEGHVRLEYEAVFIPPVAVVWNEQLGQQAQVIPRLRRPAGNRAVAAAGSRSWAVLSADPDERHWVTRGWYAGGFDSTWELPLQLPYQPEVVAAHLLRPLSMGLTAGTHAEARVAADCLAATGTVPGSGFGPMGHLALVTALASGSADTRVAAAAAWTRMTLDGRLDPDLTAATIADGVTAGVFKVNRIAESLGQAALDPAATAGVAAVGLAATAALLATWPRPAGLHLLLELAARCLAGSALPAPPGLPAPIAELAASRARTKLTEAARRLVRVG